MALVAYDCSDSSDLEDDPLDSVNKIDYTETEITPIVTREIKSSDLHPSTSSAVCDNLFTLLPSPSKNKVAIVEDDDEFLHKKETIPKPKAKITVPSPNDFKDVEGPAHNLKPKVTSGKKSGLLSMLPQPKNGVSVTTTTKSFVPHILTQKPSSTVKKKMPLPSPVAKIKQDAQSSKAQYSDESDDDEVKTDFFSINKTDDPIPVEDVPFDTVKRSYESVSLTNTVSHERKVHNIQSYFKQETLEEADVSDTSDINGIKDSSYPSYPHDNTSNYEMHAQATNSNEVVIDDEAILKLCGARGKRKREEIQIVDVNQQDVLADAREWLVKGLMDDTTKRVSASKRRGDEPTSQQRRKHQITYLAHQAKANEAELQNQWANNRVSKRQTQSKYGF